MKRYELYIDRLMSIWHRTYTSIYAESEEEAIQKCLDDDYEVDDSEFLYETEIEVDPSKDTATIEIYNEEKADPIWDNRIK